MLDLSGSSSGIVAWRGGMRRTLLFAIFTVLVVATGLVRHGQIWGATNSCPEPLVNVEVVNPYRFGVTLRVMCGKRRWAQHLPGKGKVVLMLNGRNCRVEPYFGR